MKDKFTTEEWACLLMLPGMTFHMVAATDRQLSESEMEAFLKELGAPQATHNPLHSALLSEFSEDFEGNFRKSLSAMGAMGQNMGVCQGILRENLTGKEYQSFIASMMISAIMIAESDGGSRDEAEIIGAFAEAFELDPAALQTEMQLYQ